MILILGQNVSSECMCGLHERDFELNAGGHTVSLKRCFGSCNPDCRKNRAVSAFTPVLGAVSMFNKLKRKRAVTGVMRTSFNPNSSFKNILRKYRSSKDDGARLRYLCVPSKLHVKEIKFRSGGKTESVYALDHADCKCALEIQERDDQKYKQEDVHNTKQRTGKPEFHRFH